MVFKSPKKDINIITWNANGIFNKIDELAILSNEIKVEIICIQESRLNNRKPPKLPNFYYINKPKTKSGGLIIYYKKHLKPIEIPTVTVNSETQAIRLNDLTIVNYYNGHQSPIDTSELDYIFRLGNRVIIVGDYNSRSTSWNCAGNNSNGTILRRYLESNNFVLNFPRNSYTYHPAHRATPSTIDLMITNNIQISQPYTIQALDSDHFPVLATIPRINSSALPKPTASYYTNWRLFKNLIDQNITINRELNSTEDINKCIQCFTNLIKNCLFQSTNKITHPSNHHLEIPPSIQELIKIKNKLRKRLQRNFTASLHAQYKDTINLVRGSISSLKTHKWEKFTQNLTNTDEMWRIVRSLKQNSFGISTLLGPQGLIFEDECKAKYLAETYSKNHNSTCDMSDRQTENTVKETINQFNNQFFAFPPEVLTSPEEIRRIIKLLKNKKAPGDDKIYNRTLKNLPRKAIIQLLYIFNNCLKLCYFPESWKNAIVLSFPKQKKDPKIASNYRPISLLPTMSKVLEKIILYRIKDHENIKNEIIDEQFGFRESHSTTLQLATITDQITKNFNYNKITAMLNLDIEKAFDTVWHEGLIYKLIKINFPPHLIKIIHSYLTNRTFQVRVEKTLSTKLALRAGVPQGGLLSPSLFNYFINDIPKTNSTKLKIFADDTAIVAESSNSNQVNKYIQNHLNELEKYYQKWKIKINTSKTTLIHFTHKNKLAPNPNHLIFNGQIINKQNTVKYLGLTLDRKLNFNDHINNIRQKCYILLRSLYPLLSKGSKLSKKSKIRIYKQCIRPVFLYADPIWSKTSLSNLRTLQVLQNKFLRIILNESRYTPIEEIHKTGNIELIQDKIKNDTIKFFKYTAKKLEKTKYLGTTTSQNTNIRIRHKLIHHITLT